MHPNHVAIQIRSNRLLRTIDLLHKRPFNNKRERIEQIYKDEAESNGIYIGQKCYDEINITKRITQGNLMNLSDCQI